MYTYFWVPVFGHKDKACRVLATTLFGLLARSSRQVVWYSVQSVAHLSKICICHDRWFGRHLLQWNTYFLQVTYLRPLGLCGRTTFGSIFNSKVQYLGRKGFEVDLLGLSELFLPPQWAISQFPLESHGSRLSNKKLVYGTGCDVLSAVCFSSHSWKIIRM